MTLRFWGSFKYTGHKLWTVVHDRYEPDYYTEGVCPWTRAEMDGWEAPRDEQLEGDCRRMRRDGWTFLQWWDRSGDERHGSTAGLLIDLDIDPDNLLALGMNAFSGIFERFQYGVKP